MYIASWTPEYILHNLTSIFSIYRKERLTLTGILLLHAKVGGGSVDARRQKTRDNIFLFCFCFVFLSRFSKWEWHVTICGRSARYIA